MIFASNNKNKILQVKKFLALDIVGLKEYGLDVDVIEDGKTFEENAVKKAKEINALTGEEVIADDSGLCIDFLCGWPGVVTHRFLGESATAYDRNEYILEKMKDVDMKERGCEAICVIAYADKAGNIITFEGKFASKLALKQSGENTFGFDSIMLISCETEKTVASLSDEDKLKLNARSIALGKFKRYYSELNK